ncbi:MAG: ATP-binding cassette domain-containing protein [Bacteroidales bacterium]|nr:ATP-binding cassette domain-containing protein [Bacteroidales bacterium]
MSILVEHVTKVFGEQYALDDVSFEAKKGEIVGFLGPNGAGKTTMMKIITCLIPPTQGKVSVCGLDIWKDSLELRKRIGYLSEANPLYYDMYVKEFLEFIAGVHHLSDVKSKVANIIEKTGLTPEEHKKIGALSRGFKQRVGIAQALIHDPEVLILDEPTTGLDPNQLIEIRELIRSYGKNRTVLLSTHIMQEVQAMCDHVIIINKGKLVADAQVRELPTIAEKLGLKHASELNALGMEEIFQALTQKK